VQRAKARSENRKFLVAMAKEIISGFSVAEAPPVFQDQDKDYDKD
jgi:hypothetical protein